MKNILAIIAIAASLQINAQGLRSTCENAYYATGYVKLHQYNIYVDWARISDHALVQLEDILYSNTFEVLKEQDFDGNRTKYVIKEINHDQMQAIDYELALKKLVKITGNKASCVYDI